MTVENKVDDKKEVKVGDVLFCVHLQFGSVKRITRFKVEKIRILKTKMVLDCVGYSNKELKQTFDVDLKSNFDDKIMLKSDANALYSQNNFELYVNCIYAQNLFLKQQIKNTANKSITQLTELLKKDVRNINEDEMNLLISFNEFISNQQHNNQE